MFELQLRKIIISSVACFSSCQSVYLRWEMKVDTLDERQIRLTYGQTQVYTLGISINYVSRRREGGGEGQNLLSVILGSFKFSHVFSSSADVELFEDEISFDSNFTLIMVKEDL